MGRWLEIPVPLRHRQGKGILRVCVALYTVSFDVVIGRLLAARRERRFLIWKRVVMAERVVVLGSL
ncbi:hypothetical protein HanIR_Chr12g0591651 [Helianthus annuus]|nr:hypothetical protein HanIR_Chr12g0591651 [Helianthus annuus]